MNNKQANAVIKNYKPHKGFFNLSRKPATLTKKEYAIILNTQNILAQQNEIYKDEEAKELNKYNFEVAKELSSRLQQIIFEHWGLEILEEVK